METFEINPLSADDFKTVEDWVRRDPEHQHADPGTWTDAKLGKSVFKVEANNKTTFFVSVENVARVHIQFEPGGSIITNAKSLIRGFGWFLQLMKSRGYSEIIFDSRFDSLIAFCRKTFGFQKLDNDYSVRL